MYFVVRRRWGSAWDRSRPLREQNGWTEHAELMDAWADEGFLRLAGPLGDGALLVVEAGSEETVRERLDTDPWTPTQLTTESVQPWQILIGELAP